MQSQDVKIAALTTTGNLALATIALLGLWVLLIWLEPKRGSALDRLSLIGTFVLWVGLAVILAWFTFNPALRAMKFVKSPLMFALLGVIAAVILYALRRVRKDLYGFLEILVALMTLLALGQEFDVTGQITIVIGFVGAIYVLVRGLTNIAEYWSGPRS